MSDLSVMPPERIRNFCIIAHIDHGKSTLADRILQITGAIPDREMREQFLDDMDIERERGITIKAKAVRVNYTSRKDGKTYRFNIIDTPGHVDFTYEVSRSLKACDGALLLIDATQGVQAQTLSNAYLAIEEGLELIPVINKTDLPHARTAEVQKEVETVFGFLPKDFCSVSAKTGVGIPELMEAIIEKLPGPKTEAVGGKLRALLFDAEYNDYRGVISFVKLVSGEIKARDQVCMLGTGRRCEVTEVGIFTPEMIRTDILRAGDVGYLISNIKELASVKIGDTVARWGEETEPLPGYREPQKMVYCGLYPANDVEFETLKKALERINLNDSSFSFQVESSQALSMGFRCGFMGMLHMDVIRERLERECEVSIIQTSPHVTYEIVCADGVLTEIKRPSDMPDPSKILEIREPVVMTDIVTPTEFIGAIMKLAEERRGSYVKTQYLYTDRVLLEYRIPFNEIVFDFFDRLKSLTRGYATLDYHLLGYEKSDLVKVDIKVAGQPVDALSAIMHRSKADQRGRALIMKLKKEIPKHQFQVALQASIGAKVLARENISPMRKDVTAKCYGGDITRKRKLLEKQKEGKKRMKSVGSVNIPQDAFMAVLDVNRED